MPPFVDIHLHLLPGLDDGPATLDAALEAAEVAIADGIVAVVATPHSNYQWPFQSGRVQQLRTEMQAAVGERLRVTTGCELHLSYENVQAALADPRVFTLNASRYLLVEFPELFDREAFASVLEQFAGNGVIPVLAHPERNPVLQQHPPTLQRYLQLGCVSQVTAASFTGRFGKRAQQFAAEWLDQEWIHVVASDGHAAQQRPPRLSKAYSWIADHAGVDVAEALCCANPLAMLEDRELPFQPDLATARKRSLWARLRG